MNSVGNISLTEIHCPKFAFFKKKKGGGVWLADIWSGSQGH